jgi:hypothetical protein
MVVLYSCLENTLLRNQYPYSEIFHQNYLFFITSVRKFARLSFVSYYCSLFDALFKV